MSITVTSYIPTTGVVDARASDELYFPLAGRPQAMTVYLRFIEHGAIKEDANLNTVLNIGGAQPPLMSIDVNGAAYRLRHRNGNGEVNATMGTSPNIGDQVELRGVIDGNGKTQLHQTINTGAETSATQSGALTFAQAFAQSRIYLNSKGGTQYAVSRFRNAVVARGTQSLATMRRLAKVT